MDLESNALRQNANPFSEVFRPLLNTSSTENREKPIETARMINDDNTSQVVRKLDELKSDMTSPILEPINSAVTEKVPYTNQKRFVSRREDWDTALDHRYGGLHRSPKQEMLGKLPFNWFQA